MGEDAVPGIEFAAIERGLEGVRREGLAKDSCGLEKPPQIIAPLRGCECGPNESIPTSLGKCGSFPKLSLGIEFRALLIDGVHNTRTPRIGQATISTP